MKLFVGLLLSVSVWAQEKAVTKTIDVDPAIVIVKFEQRSQNSREYFQLEIVGKSRTLSSYFLGADKLPAEIHRNKGKESIFDLNLWLFKAEQAGETVHVNLTNLGLNEKNRRISKISDLFTYTRPEEGSPAVKRALGRVSQRIRELSESDGLQLRDMAKTQSLAEDLLRSLETPRNP